MEESILKVGVVLKDVGGPTLIRDKANFQYISGCKP